MSRLPRNTLRAFGFGTAFVVLTALACLAGAAQRDRSTLSLQQFAELTHTESVLMSCADDLPLSSGGDLQWCSDPSAPHCRPAAPPAPRLELWDNPLLTLLPRIEPPAVTSVLLPWPRPEASSLRSHSDVYRLERPPRA